MDIQTFFKLNEILDRRSANVLGAKSAEYSQGGDKLHNFKAGAIYRNKTSEEILAGMMMKHTTSIYDLIDEVEQHYHTSEGETRPLSLWLEKVIDHINFLKLLFALRVEHMGQNLDDVQDLCNEKPLTKGK